jgi:plastocyanin
MNPHTLRTHPIDRALRVVGAGALLATAGIHLDLYLTGYRHIPTIGVLFLLQVVSAGLLGVAVVVRGGFFLSASASAFCASTIGGYLLSRAVGLFGFKEVPTTAGLVAGLVEVLGLLVLGIAAARAVPQVALGSRVASAVGSRASTERIALGVVGLLGVAALVLTVLAGTGGTSSTTSRSAVASTPSSRSGSVVITITNFSFSPERLVVKPGEKIVVENHDSVAHTVTAVPGSSPFGGFDTGNVAPGQSKVVTAPHTPGTYQYFCSIHNFMTGVLIVS